MKRKDRSRELYAILRPFADLWHKWQTEPRDDRVDFLEWLEHQNLNSLIDAFEDAQDVFYEGGENPPHEIFEKQGE